MSKIQIFQFSHGPMFTEPISQVVRSISSKSMWFELTYCIVTLPGRIAIRIRWSIGNVLSSTGDARTCVISGHIVFHFLGQDIFQKKACNITTHSKHDRIASNRWQFGIKITLNTNIIVKVFFERELALLVALQVTSSWKCNPNTVSW